jgi:hypothetical protein
VPIHFANSDVWERKCVNVGTEPLEHWLLDHRPPGEAGTMPQAYNREVRHKCANQVAFDPFETRPVRISL